MHTAKSGFGLSPRVRGNPLLVQRLPDIPGSIPAYAEKPQPRRGRKRPTWAYPRICGGTCSYPSSLRRYWVLSPRVRRNRRRVAIRDRDRRSIPARTGNATSAPHFNAPVWGLSPRMRGNPDRRVIEQVAVWSIPACTGEPSSWATRPSGSWVYPRVCGGTHPVLTVGRCVDGLSPRVRGNRIGYEPVGRDRGSIPACAGEPGALGRGHGQVQVYPRVCGGTCWLHLLALARLGLSPRVRGNPVNQRGRHDHAGSIPACAGEPAAGACTWTKPKVYPRCAGEPPRMRVAVASVAVYPRVCRGTGVIRELEYPETGLSPRVRGNPVQLRVDGILDGSIPACAGEPTSWSGCRPTRWVYPRMCGGTSPTYIALFLGVGLSPRVQGNRLCEGGGP